MKQKNLYKNTTIADRNQHTKKYNQKYLHLFECRSLSRLEVK